MSCIHFARQHGFRELFPVGKMCFVDNAIRDPVCGDHPFATATTTRRRASESGAMRSVGRSYFYRPIRGKITIVRQTKCCYNGIANAIKECLLLAHIAPRIELRGSSFMRGIYFSRILIERNLLRDRYRIGIMRDITHYV